MNNSTASDSIYSHKDSFTINNDQPLRYVETPEFVEPIIMNTPRYSPPINPDYDQTVKLDDDKLRYELVPVEVEEELAKVLTYGAKKYKANSWQNVEPFNDRYYAALRRHVAAWRKGEVIDKESGLHHLSHALTCIAFLLSKELGKS
jgi:hypothetical protein